jgi:hypothetical protein
MIIKIQVSNFRNLDLKQPVDTPYMQLVLHVAQKTKKRFFDSIRRIFVDYDRVYIYTNLQLSSTNLSVITSFFVGLLNKLNTKNIVIECSTGIYPDTEEFEAQSKSRYDVYKSTYHTIQAKNTLFGDKLPVVEWEDLPEEYRTGVTIQ